MNPTTFDKIPAEYKGMLAQIGIFPANIVAELKANMPPLGNHADDLKDVRLVALPANEKEVSVAQALQDLRSVVEKKYTMPSGLRALLRAIQNFPLSQDSYYFLPVVFDDRVIYAMMEWYPLHPRSLLRRLVVQGEWRLVLQEVDFSKFIAPGALAQCRFVVLER